jgi:hypothetical protein
MQRVTYSTTVLPEPDNLQATVGGLFHLLGRK